MGNFWKMYEEVKAHEEQPPTQIIEQTKVAPKDPEQPQQVNVSRETLPEVVEEEVTTETLEGVEENGVAGNTDL